MNELLILRIRGVSYTMAKKANSLAHTKGICKYHIVFTPKYRRKVIYNQNKEGVRDIIKKLCGYSEIFKQMDGDLQGEKYKT